MMILSNINLVRLFLDFKPNDTIPCPHELFFVNLGAASCIHLDANPNF